MRVIGTAGHVDHGKSTLVSALTGINPDRLKEEQEREMTIDLGFAWLTLPDGEVCGIVDVPGHRDFIENMLAGIGGIDAALFVVAADEGVMPQTREHLSILDILQISAGVIVITKVDTVDDPDWLDLIVDDVQNAVKSTALADAPFVKVSAKKGIGLDELKTTLAAVLQKQSARPDLGRPRLPVDRVFTISGFGTIVTGTLLDGKLHTGDEVEILPGGLKGRIRGLQTHKKKEDFAVPGSRTAVNITGVQVGEIRRGDVVVHPRQFKPTRRIDVQFRLLPDASRRIEHDEAVKLFIGASEVMARIRLLGQETLDRGQSGWLQLELREPILAARGDRYILRCPSPAETLGGGIVLDPHPKRRYKRFSSRELQRLEAIFRGDPKDVLFQNVGLSGISTIQEVVTKSGIPIDEALEYLDSLIESEEVILLSEGKRSDRSDGIVVSKDIWSSKTIEAERVLKKYHNQNPLRRGMLREELKSRLGMSPNNFNLILNKWVQSGNILEKGIYVKLKEHEVVFTPQQQKSVDGLMKKFKENRYSPPTVKDSQAELGEELYLALVDSGVFVQVSNDVVFEKSVYAELVQGVKRYLEKNGTMSAAQFRDEYQTSRRYALALLEHLDEIGITYRDGDVRKAGRGSNRV